MIVPDDQLSLAIGREGQNARLAAKLTGWRIDIKSVSEAALNAVSHLDVMPLSKMVADAPDMITEVQRILDKKRADRAVTPEEYNSLSRFVQMVEQRQIDQREVGRSRRKKAMDKVRSSIPAFAFTIPVENLNLPETIMGALKNIETAGDLMLRVQADVEKLREVLTAAKAEDDALMIIDEALQDALRAQPAVAAAPIVEQPVAMKAPEAVADQQAAADQALVAEAVLPVVDEALPLPTMRTRRLPSSMICPQCLCLATISHVCAKSRR